MHKTNVNISSIALREGCNLILFIGSFDCGINTFNICIILGRVVFEEQAKGISFNPFVMLHDDNKESVHNVFASVPSIFGGVGHDLRETKFFDW